MKKFLLAMLFGLLAFSVYAEANVDVSDSSGDAASCPGDEELANVVWECGQENLGYETYYDDEQCRQVKCIEMESENESDDGIGAGNETDAEIENESECPSGSELEEDALDCREKGYSHYVYYDENNCKQVKCNSTYSWGCRNETELNRKIHACKEDGLSYKYETTSAGCREVVCARNATNNTCPNVDAWAKECKAKGMAYETYWAEGCKLVKCKEQTESVTCKKTSENGCVAIRCEDGYYYNSCANATGCTAAITTAASAKGECKEYKDENGCEVKECANGYTKKECPEAELENETELEDENETLTAQNATQARSMFTAFFDWFYKMFGSK